MEESKIRTSFFFFFSGVTQICFGEQSGGNGEGDVKSSSYLKVGFGSSFKSHSKSQLEILSTNEHFRIGTLICKRIPDFFLTRALPKIEKN